MKIKVSKKQMREFNKIISIGYCDASELLKYQEPFAYSTGVNGWSCDYYKVGSDIIISTGYSPLKEKNTKSNYNIVAKYNELAKNINFNYDLSYEEAREKVNNLLGQYIKEVAF